MQGFSGFLPPAEQHPAAVPEQFFTDLLPLIDHLAELKVTAYALWQLSRQTEVKYPCLRQTDFLADPTFLRGLAAAPHQAAAVLEDALERAVARGTLLQVQVGAAPAGERVYFANSAQSRAAIDRLARGEWQPAGLAAASVTPTRPTVFTLYEQNIGPLTPLVADELREALADYPAAWIEDAIRIAVRNNARKLKYILAVLARMRTEGRHDHEKGDKAENDFSGYDGYSEFVTRD